MENYPQYQEWSAVQDRLAAVLGRISSMDETQYDRAVETLGLTERHQTALENLSELFQSSLTIRDHYFQATTDSLVATISRGVSMVGRFWGFADMTAANAVARLSAAVADYERAAKAVEEFLGAPARGSGFVAQPLPGDPLEVGKEEIKRDAAKTLTQYIPWLVGVLVVLFLVRKYL